MKKFYSCARLAVASAGRGATVLHGNSGRIGRVGGGPGDTCIAFFRYWTENFCQVDGGGRVLWPQGRTVGEVFSTTFQDWLAQQNSPESVVSGVKVSLSTFRNALADPEFAHVKMRKEHHHVRCDKYVSFLMNVVDVFHNIVACRCKALQEQVNAGFENNAKVLAYLERKKSHEAMVEDFRRLEKYWLGQARHSPANVHMFQYDDTTPFLIPHFGNRESKSVASKSRIQLVPWLVENVGFGQKTYVYCFKGATDKGANRWYPLTFPFCLTVLSRVGARTCTMSFGPPRPAPIVWPGPVSSWATTTARIKTITWWHFAQS